jgi:hypothetical protein
MAPNPLRIRSNSGRDINILRDTATDDPVTPSSSASAPSTPTPWQPQHLSLHLRQRSPSSHRSLIQLPPLSDQGSSAPEMRRRRTDCDLNRNNMAAISIIVYLAIPNGYFGLTHLLDWALFPLSTPTHFYFRLERTSSSRLSWIFC